MTALSDALAAEPAADASCAERNVGVPRIGLTPVSEIEGCIAQAVDPISDSTLRPVADASGWTTAADHHAKLPLPLFSQSAVDGYALAGDAGSFRINALCRAGQVPGVIGAGEAVHIMTGAPLPEDADRIAMQERVVRKGDRIDVLATRPGDNIRRCGEDIRRGELAVPAGRRLDAGSLALLAATGHDAVSCVRKLRVALVATGSELDDRLSPGKIRDSNTPMLAALLRSAPDIETTLHTVADERSALTRRMVSLLPGNDLIVTTGGMSSGIEDHVRDACRALGGRFLIEGVAMKPGKPVGLARIGNAFLLGLPGNPFAALATFAVVGRPLLTRLRGRAAARPTPAVAGFALDRKPGRTEFFPARRNGCTEHGAPVIERLGKGGSARLAPLSSAEGLGVIKADVERVEQGDMIGFLDFTTAWSL